jgi:hypothetical protein
MTLDEIRQECWDEARETATNDLDRLWTTSEMNRYINRVYRNIARETRCIRDSISSDICRITSTVPASLAILTAQARTDDFAAQDLAWYNSTDSWLYHTLVAPYSFALSPYIITVDEVKWTDKQWRLTHVSIKKWQVNPWWEQVIGMATEYATDGDTNRVFVNFRTTDTDTLKLTVRRLPIVDLIEDSDKPEFKIDYHDFFKNGVLSLMYAKQDSQTFDAVKTVDYKSRFLADLDEIKQSEALLDNRLRANSSLDAFR